MCRLEVVQVDVEFRLICGKWVGLWSSFLVFSVGMIDADIWLITLWWLWCSYVECTSAAIQSLTAFKKLYPGHRREEVERCIERAAMFIEKIQASDGSWWVSLQCCYPCLSSAWVEKWTKSLNARIKLDLRRACLRLVCQFIKRPEQDLMFLTKNKTKREHYNVRFDYARLDP